MENFVFCAVLSLAKSFRSNGPKESVEQWKSIETELNIDPKNADVVHKTNFYTILRKILV